MDHFKEKAMEILEKINENNQQKTLTPEKAIQKAQFSRIRRDVTRMNLEKLFNDVKTDLLSLSEQFKEIREPGYYQELRIRFEHPNIRNKNSEFYIHWTAHSNNEVEIFIRNDRFPIYSGSFDIEKIKSVVQKEFLEWLDSLSQDSTF